MQVFRCQIQRRATEFKRETEKRWFYWAKGRVVTHGANGQSSLKQRLRATRALPVRYGQRGMRVAQLRLAASAHNWRALGPATVTQLAHLMRRSAQLASRVVGSNFCALPSIGAEAARANSSGGRDEFFPLHFGATFFSPPPPPPPARPLAAHAPCILRKGRAAPLIPRQQKARPAGKQSRPTRDEQTFESEAGGSGRERLLGAREAAAAATAVAGQNSMPTRRGERRADKRAGRPAAKGAGGRERQAVWRGRIMNY